MEGKTVGPSVQGQIVPGQFIESQSFPNEKVISPLPASPSTSPISLLPNSSRQENADSGTIVSFRQQPSSSSLSSSSSFSSSSSSPLSTSPTKKDASVETLSALSDLETEEMKSDLEEEEKEEQKEDNEEKRKEAVVVVTEKEVGEGLGKKLKENEETQKVVIAAKKIQSVKKVAPLFSRSKVEGLKIPDGKVEEKTEEHSIVKRQQTKGNEGGGRSEVGEGVMKTRKAKEAPVFIMSRITPTKVSSTDPRRVRCIFVRIGTFFSAWTETDRLNYGRNFGHVRK